MQPFTLASSRVSPQRGQVVMSASVTADGNSAERTGVILRVGSLMGRNCNAGVGLRLSIGVGRCRFAKARREPGLRSTGRCAPAAPPPTLRGQARCCTLLGLKPDIVLADVLDVAQQIVAPRLNTIGDHMTRGASRALLTMIGAALLALPPRPVNAQTLVEHSSEARFQLDVHVPDAALATFLPAGWSLNVAAQGAAEGANLRVVFIDRVSINGPDGKPLGRTGSNRLVYLVAPVKDASGANVQLVVGGLTEDPADAPGPFGVYLHASTATMQRSSTSSAAGTVLDSQDWVFAAPSGEHLEMHVKFTRGVGNKGNASDTRFYSSKDPAFFQISRQEQVLDILRNVTTTPPDRVTDFSFTASGGSYSRFFDGTQKVLSWDNILWINRSVLLP